MLHRDTAPQSSAKDGPTAKLSRRTFVSAAAGTFAFGVALRSGPASADATAGGLVNTIGGDATPSLFIEILKNGTILLTNHRSEMGQQVTTAMAQIIADELEADWDDIKTIQAQGHPRYGDQNTDGSRSVRRNLHRLRTVGAAMRAMLHAAAAQEWGADPADISSALGVITHGPTGKTVRYGALAAKAAQQSIPLEEALTLKQRSQWRYIGQAVASLTIPALTRGEGTFGMDVRLEGMVYAVIARPPQSGGKVIRFDDAAALKTPGVLQTLQMPDAGASLGYNPLGGVAVIGTDSWAAIQGRKALTIEWDPGTTGGYNTEDFKQQLLATANQPGDVRRTKGDVAAAMKGAAQTLSADYFVPHLAQAPMEPPVATAQWTGDKVECWASIQAPQQARKTVADVCGIPEDNVTINVMLLGGGFGRKSKPDFVAEAALVARAAGKPVKVFWTREDDLQHGYLHTISGQHLEAGLDKDGNTTAFLHRTVFPPISSTFIPSNTSPSWGELRMGAADTPFEVPNFQLETGDAQTGIRTGWLRSVANVYHAFAVQSFVHELADAAGRDPKDYLLEMIGRDRLFDPNDEGAKYDNYGDTMEDYPIDTARLKAVIKKAAAMANWGRKAPKGSGIGIAAHRSFLSYVATVMQVAVGVDGDLTITGVWTAMDAGTVVNPGHAKAQIEGGTIYGISNALYGEITAKNGAVEQANFPDWRVLRMSEAPRTFETHIMESVAPPAGVGEPPTPPAAPALANAIFAATGMRYRQLPIMGAQRVTLPLGTRKI